MVVREVFDLAEQLAPPGVRRILDFFARLAMLFRTRQFTAIMRAIGAFADEILKS